MIIFACVSTFSAFYANLFYAVQSRLRPYSSNSFQTLYEKTVQDSGAAKEKVRIDDENTFAPKEKKKIDERFSVEEEAPAVPNRPSGFATENESQRYVNR